MVSICLNKKTTDTSQPTGLYIRIRVLWDTYNIEESRANVGDIIVLMGFESDSLIVGKLTQVLSDTSSPPAFHICMSCHCKGNVTKRLRFFEVLFKMNGLNYYTQ
jgi:hypothetical protein